LRSPLQALLFLALDFLNALLRDWHIFGHDSASFSNCPAHDPAHLEMNLVSFPFAEDLFALKFLTRLARTERICNQLITIHPVQNALALLKTFTRVNLILGKGIETLVAKAQQSGVITPDCWALATSC
jgi:hypothetical protein